jgi:large subunit ribosomal protein L25
MLEAIIRESIGKKATKALRRDGYLIGNIYGNGFGNLNVAFKMGDYLRAVKSKSGIAFDVKIGEQTVKVVVQDYQVHPITDVLLHVDLIAAQEGVVTTYHVPVVPVGTPIGLKNKGVLIVAKKRLPVKSAIENLPNSIEINVNDLDVGDAILIRDLAESKTLDIRLSDRVAVLSVIKAK